MKFKKWSFLLIVMMTVLFFNPNLTVYAEETHTVNLVAVGDDLLHMSVIKACQKGYSKSRSCLYQSGNYSG